MSGSSGQRRVEDEKRVLTELARLFHVAKANSKESGGGAQMTSATQPASVKVSGKAKDKKKESHKSSARRGSQRRSKRGGSIWIVLKGGFSASTLPPSSDATSVQSRAQVRAQRSEKKRLAALEMAEAYVQSAWANAQEAGLAVKDATTGALVPTAEGELYLREQYTIAARMLRPRAVGSHLQSVVRQATAAAAPLDAVALPPYAGVVSRSTWESAIPRELAILNYGMRASGDAEEKTRADVEAATTGYYFPLAEPVTTANDAGSAAAVDVVPTKCFMRVVSSQRQRHTAVLATAKAVNYFKANFMSVLRKELSGSKLPRGAEESLDGVEAAAAGVTGKGTGSGQHPQVHGANRGDRSRHNPSGKSGKQHKRK